MAKEYPNLKHFKKGESGNPAGAQKHDPEFKAVKNLTKKEMIEVGNLIVKNDYSQLLKLAQTTKATSLQKMIASVVVKIIQEGDMKNLNILLDRLIGKVKDEIVHHGDLNAPQIILTLPDNGRTAKTEAKLDDDEDYGF